MPIYEITAPNGRTYEIEGPSGASKEDAVRALLAKFPEAGKKPPEPTMGGYVQESLKAIPRGFVGGLESAALGAAALLPGDTETGFERTAREGIKGLAERFKPSVAAGYEEAIPVKLAEAVGSMGTLLIPGGAAGLAAKGLGAAQGAQRVAQLAATTPVAGAMGAGEARERAVAAGATPEQIQTATTAGVVPGLAEMLPVERIFRKMPDELKGGILERVKRALVTGGFEGAQEAASAIAQNLIAKGVYKPSQELIEGVGEQAAYGVGAGAIVQFLVDAVAGRRAPPKGAAERAQRLEEERTAAEKQAVVDAFNALPGEVTADKVAAADQKIEAIKADLKTLGKQQRGGSPEANALRQEIRKLQQIKKLGEYGGTQTDLFGEVGGGFTPLTARPEATTEQDKQQFLMNYRRALNDLEQISAQKAQAEEMNNQAAISYFGRLEQQRKAALDAFEEQGKKLGVSEDELSVASRGVVGQLQSLRNRQKTLNSKGNYDEAAALQPRIETLEQQLAETTGTPLEREAGQRAERQAGLFAEEMEAKPYPSVAPKVAQPEVPPEVAAKLEQLQGQRAQLVDQKKTTSGARAKYIQNQIDALDQDINALQQQGIASGEYASGAVFGEQALEQLTEAQEARLQQARDVFNTQRQQRQQEAEAQQVGERSEQIAQVAPIEAMLIARGIKVEEPRPLSLKRKTLTKELLAQPRKEKMLPGLGEGVTTSNLRESIDNVNLTAPVQKLLGLTLPQEVSLADEQGAQTALPIIQQRIYDLESARRTEFPSKTLVEDGKLTKDGQRLVGTEAALNVLRRLESVAKMSLPQPEMTAAERTAVEKLGALPESRVTPAKAAETIASLRQQRAAALSDFGAAIDGLRRGEATDPVEIDADKQRTRELINNLMFFVTREAQLARVMNNKGAASPEQINQLVRPLRARLEQLLENAKPAGSQREADLMRLLAGAIQSQDRAGIAQYRQELARERQRLSTPDTQAKTIRLQNGVEVTKTATQDGGSNTVVTREGRTVQNTTKYKYDASVDGEKTVIRVEKNNITGETEAFFEINGAAVGSGLGIKQLVANGISVENALKKVLPTTEFLRKRKSFEGVESTLPSVIERGMTTGDVTKLTYPAQRIAQGESELGRLQAEIAKTIYKLGYTKRAAKQRVTPPFALQGEMAAERKVAAVQNMLARAKAEGDEQGAARAEEILQGLRAPATADKQNVANKLDEALRREVPEADRAVLERAADMLARGSVPKELVAEVNDVADSILMGREADLSGLQSELRRAEEALMEAPGQREIEMPEARSFMRATPANLKRAAFIQKSKAQERKRVEETKKRAEQGRTTEQKIETIEQAFEEAKREANSIVRKEEQRIRDAIAKTDEFAKMAQGLRKKTFTLAQFKKLLGLNPTLDPVETKALADKYEKTAEEQLQFDKDVLYTPERIQAFLDANKDFKEAESRLNTLLEAAQAEKQRFQVSKNAKPSAAYKMLIIKINKEYREAMSRLDAAQNFINPAYMQAVLKANKQYQEALSRLAAAEKYIAELKTMGQAQALKKRLDAVENARKQTDRQLYDAHDDAAAKLKKWAEASGATMRTVTVERTPVKVSAKTIEAIPEEKRGELLQTQTLINELTEHIRSIAQTLGLKTKEQQALDPYLDADTVRKFSSEQRKLYNQRLELIDERERLRERMVTRRLVTVQKPSAEERAEQTAKELQEQLHSIAARILPRQYNEIEIQIAKVEKQIADLPKSKAAIQRLKNEVTNYTKEINRIRDVNKNASPAAVEQGKKQISDIRKKLNAINKALNKKTRSALETQLTALKDQRRNIAQRAVKYDVDLGARTTKQETQKAMQPVARTMTEIAEREQQYGAQRKGATKANVPEMRTDEEIKRQKESQDRRKAARPQEDEGPIYGEPDFRDATDADTGVDAGEAKTVADRVQKALPEGIKFVYAPTLVDAPAAFRKALERSGRTAAKGAVMPDGTVIVIGEAHKSTADLQETIAHELIGHYGADMVLGKDGVQALTDKLFGRGLDHVAEVAVGLGVYPDIASARIALGASKPQVNMTRRRLLQAAGAAIAKPVMPLDVSKAFEITDPKAALDDLYDAWRKADKWVNKIVKMLPSSLQEEAKDVLHTTLYRIGGENFYEAWTNQGEDWVTASLIEEAVEKEGVKTLTANIKRAYDVAAADIAALVKPQASKQETKETAATQDFSDAFKTTFVRELIARAAEGRRVAPTFAEKVKTFIRDMVGAVRGWFRNSGLSDLAKQDTKQIQALIRDAERELKNSRPGVYISPDGNAVFRDGASSDLDWMSDTSKEVLQRVVAQEKSAIDTVKGNVLGLTGVTQFIDRTAPFLAALQKGVATKKISELEASQARYYLVAHDKRMNFTRNVAANGPLELKKFTEGAANYWMVQNKEGKDNPTLLKMFKALGESGMNADEAGRVFTLWLAAQRVKNEGIGVEALNYGKDKDGQPLLTAEKLRGVEKDVASQPKIAAAFEKARKEYNAYNAGLIDFAVQAGRISPEVAADLKRKKDYIPFYRQMGGEVKLFIGSEGAPITIGNLKDQPYLNELVGGDKPIQDVFTSSIQNTHMLTDMALRNITTKNVVYTLRKLGMLEAGRGGMVVRPKAGPASPLTIRFMENGVEKHAIVKTEGTIFEDIPAELLVKGLEGVKTTFPAALQLLGAPAKLLRRFVVLNPLYPVRQIMRDSLSAYGTSGADFNPIFDPVRNVVKAMIKKSPSAKELEERGLLGGQLLAGEGLEGMSTILRGVTGGKGNLSTALAWLESKSMYADVGTRVSAYDSYKRMGFNDLDAFLATNDIIDFNRRGMSPSVYFANTLIPFFNTQLQSLNVTYRAARGRMPYEERLDIKNKFVRRGIGMAVMTMLYAALMEDDEAYKNATPEQRLANWFVRVPGLDEPVRIPIPFEYGLLFKAIPEAVVNVAFGTDEGAPIAKGLATLAWQSVPNLTPQVGKPFIELATGKDLFTGADVETARMQRLDPTERFKDDTTELAKVLSSVGQGVLSPVQIDQFVRGVGTQLAVAVMSAANPILRDPNTPPSPEMKASKLPVVGSLMQPNDGNRVIDYVYEQMGKAEQARNTYNKLMEEGRDAEAERYINREAGRIALSDSVADFRKEMKDIRDAEEAIKRDPDMTSEQKRDELTELRKLKLQIAADYRDIIRQSSE